MNSSYIALALLVIACGPGEGSSDSAVVDASRDTRTVIDSAGDVDFPIDAARDTIDTAIDTSSSDASVDVTDTRPSFHDVRILETGTPDAAPRPPLVDTDTLQLTPQAVSIDRGATRCFALSLVHEDGSTTAIDGGDAVLVSRNANVAIATTASDCSSVGVLGLHEGTTTAEVTFREGDVVLRAVARVAVSANAISFRVADFLSGVVGLTMETAIFATSTQPSLAHPSPSLVRGLRAVPDIAELALTYPLESDRTPQGFVLSFTGREVGTMELYLTYGVTGEEREIRLGSIQLLPRDSPRRVFGVALGTPNVFSSNAIQLNTDTGTTWIAPGCYPVWANVLHQAIPNGPFALRYDNQITVTSPTAGATISPGTVQTPPQICLVESARLDLHVCASGACGDVIAVVGDPRSVASVIVSNANLMFPVRAGGLTSECSGCVPLRVTANMRDGSTRDIGGSPTAYVHGWPGFVYGTASDVPGNVCFRVMQAPTPAYYNYGNARAEMNVRCVLP